MTTFATILLIVILVLITSDVFFLYKIYKNIDKKKKGLPEEKYFELKYNINLLKAVSAILIFLIGFLGFTTYGEIEKNVEENFSEMFSMQNSKIDSLSQVLSEYEDFIDSLELRKNVSIENLDDVRREFGTINRKVSQTQEALKYIPRIFLIKNILYDGNKESREIGKGVRFNYNILRDIYGEKLPVFKSPPMVIIGGNNAEYSINENTNMYFDISKHSIQILK